MAEHETARIIRVMIGSPGETSEERRAIAETLNRWNAVHGRDYGVILQAVTWEIDAAPDLQGRPQEMINKELIPKSDFLIAVFRSRIGTPTGKEVSGTVEEIQEFRKAGKRVLLYFYQGEVALCNLDSQQFSLLTQFKQEMLQAGLVGDYSDISQLREHLSYHLTSIVRKLVGPHAEGKRKSVDTATTSLREPVESRPVENAARSVVDLSPAAVTTLVAAASSDGIILVYRSSSGQTVGTGGTNLVEDPYNDRLAAEYVHAIEQLEEQRLIAPTSWKRNTFRVTHNGYLLADELKPEGG